MNPINDNNYFYRDGEISIQINGSSIKESMVEISNDSCEEFSNDLVDSVYEKEDASTSKAIEVE